MLKMMPRYQKRSCFTIVREWFGNNEKPRCDGVLFGRFFLYLWFFPRSKFTVWILRTSVKEASFFGAAADDVTLVTVRTFTKCFSGCVVVFAWQ